jgi:AcrR family transcriptional regulator
MAKQKRDATLTKKKILTTARRLFSKQGYDATTVDDIAKESEFNKALIYYYFKNKSGLYSEVMSGLFNAIYDAVVEGERDCTNAIEELEVFINSYTAHAYKNPYFSALLLRELSNSGAHVPEMMFTSMRRVYSLLIDILKRGESEKVFSTSVPMIVHFMIIGSINLMVTTEHLRNEAILLDKNIDTCSECSSDKVARYVFQVVKKSLEV